MNKPTIQLGDFYSVKKLTLIISAALSDKWNISFLNTLTGEPQILTRVQLHGLTQLQKITILLETGQTYQQGLNLEENENSGTYQDVSFIDLLVDEEAFKKISASYPVTSL